jgi:hypothetical protein
VICRYDNIKSAGPSGVCADDGIKMRCSAGRFARARIKGCRPVSKGVEKTALRAVNS